MAKVARCAGLQRLDEARLAANGKLVVEHFERVVAVTMQPAILTAVEGLQVVAVGGELYCLGTLCCGGSAARRRC
jgi:hypothetical protein